MDSVASCVVVGGGGGGGDTDGVTSQLHKELLEIPLFVAN